MILQNPRLDRTQCKARKPTRSAERLRRITVLCVSAACLIAAGCHKGGSTTTPTLGVSITSPTTSPTLQQGQSVNIVAAVVNDSKNLGVTFTLSGIGSLVTTNPPSTSTVTYQAPATVSAATTVTVTATSITNTSISSILSIHVTPPIAVVVLPPATGVPADGGQETFNATVSYDQNSAGVTWALSAACVPVGCAGTLTNSTTTSVTYIAPTSIPTPNAVTLTATSVADNTKSNSATITVTLPAPIVVTINNKISNINAGSSPIQFNATVQNDPTPSNGVQWTLMAGGSNCQPTCGTLSSTTTNPTTYTPPAGPNPPSAPNNTPTLTATSVSDNTKSDSDTFTIQASTANNLCAGTPTGHESLLSGEYAVLLQGWNGTGAGTPVALGASFAAGGAGNVTGGILDLNRPLSYTSPSASQQLTINPIGSLYTVGLDPTGSGNLACLTLATTIGPNAGPTLTFHLSLGGVSAGVASKGRIIEFDDSNGNGTVGSGILRLQTGPFLASSLQPNYAFGLDGADSKGGAVSIAGTFAASTAGAITNGFADVNDAVTASGALTGGSGSITGISAGTGRGTATFSAGSHSYNWAVYMVNASEFLIIETDTLSSTSPVTSGRALATASSFGTTALSGNYILHQNGIANCNQIPCARVELDLINFSNGVLNGQAVDGAVNGQINQYDQNAGFDSQAVINATYALNSTSGRVTLAETGSTIVFPVLYPVSPAVDGVSGFIVGQDNNALFGLAEFQPSMVYSNAAVAGNFLVGTEDPRDNAVTNEVGTLSITSQGAVRGTEDRSGQTGMSVDQILGGNVSINSDGTGSVWVSFFTAITNGTKIFYIDVSGGSARITVFELQ